MKKKLESVLKKTFGVTSFDILIPEKPEFGHYSTNLALRLAKTKNKNPLKLAGEIVAKIENAAPKNFFEKIEIASPGFINFWISKNALQEEFKEICARGKKYGRQNIGRDRKIIIEYSSPNIAKPMHVGHLRSTIIGDALANIHEFLGYKVIRWNYIGDWGTQFGKLIAAYKLWGNEKNLEKEPIQEMLRLYIKFHEEAERDPELEKIGQWEFRKLEEGDKKNRKLWQWLRRESLGKFGKIYKTLGIKFDVVSGEASLEKELAPFIEKLKRRKIATESRGAFVIPLEKFGLPPALIQKSDEASLYLTREIAGLEQRLKKYNPEKILYVVSNEQSLHFQQFSAIVEILSLKKIGLAHIKFGLVLGDSGKKFSTRAGTAVPLEELIVRAVKLARQAVEKKNPRLPAEEKSRIAEAVGVGALKYNDLRENRNSDIVFDWRKMLDFSGDSAPYLQYTYARLKSILRKAADRDKKTFSPPAEEQELQIVRKLIEFPGAAEKSAEAYLPNHLAKYLYELAVAANKFYETTPILKDENKDRRRARLALIEMIANILKTGLNLLGIKTLERM